MDKGGVGILRGDHRPLRKPWVLISDELEHMGSQRIAPGTALCQLTSESNSKNTFQSYSAVELTRCIPDHE